MFVPMLLFLKDGGLYVGGSRTGELCVKCSGGLSCPLLRVGGVRGDELRGSRRCARQALRCLVLGQQQRVEC